MERKSITDTLVLKDKNYVVKEEELNTILHDLDVIKESTKNYEEALREALVKVLTTNGENNIKLKDYTISLVVYKSTIEFNKDAFLENESDDIILTFSNEIETKFFNEKKFKEENPDLYNKYYESQYDIQIKEDELSKMRPDIYEKYVKVVPTTKKPTIAIKEVKKEKGKK